MSIEEEKNLIQAVSSGNHEEAQKLLKKGISPNLQVFDETLSLEVNNLSGLAIVRSDLEMFKLLCQYKALYAPCFQETSLFSEIRPLVAATLTNCLDIVRFLSEYPAILKHDGYKALQAACIYQRVEVVELLLATEQGKALLKTKNRFQRSLLFYAIWGGSTRIFDLLVSFGCYQPNPDHWGLTLMELALYKGNQIIINRLLCLGARIPEILREKESFLSSAVFEGDCHFVHFLFDCGANLAARKPSDPDLLSYAQTFRMETVLRELDVKAISWHNVPPAGTVPPEDRSFGTCLEEYIKLIRVSDA